MTWGLDKQIQQGMACNMKRPETQKEEKSTVKLY